MSRRIATMAIILVALAVAAPAMAQEHGEAAGHNPAIPWGLFAPALAIGVAAAAGSLGQGKGLAAACEAIGRNPGAVGAIRITMIIGLALIESLVIYALVIAFMLLP